MINWREYPFIKLLLPFVTGIGLAIYFEVGSFSHLLIVACILMVIILILYRIRGNIRANYAFSIITLIGFILIGYMWTLGRSELHHPQHFQQHLTDEIQPIWGVISDMPVEKGEKIKFVLALRAITENRETINAVGNILVYLPKDSLTQKLQYGDPIAIAGRLQEISPPSNPHTFDYRQYLHYKNIHYQSFVKAGNWREIGENQGNPILKTAFHIRLNFIKTLRKYLKDDNQFAVGSALILGYKDEITDEVRDAYAGTGAIHVLAVSGLHVGLIFLILNVLLKIFTFQQTWWRVLRVLILLTGIWAFAILTGASPSVLRAATMFTFVTIGMSLKQPTNIYNTLAGSAVILLFYNPLLLMNVGFQLSYLAVVGIVYFQPKIAEKWIIRNPIGNYLWQLVAVSIAAQLMTLPLSLFYFHQFPCFFWLSGLIVVPAAGVILAAGITIFVFEPLLPWIAAQVGWCLDALISMVNWGVFLIHQLPYSVVRGIWIGGLGAFLLYLIIFCFICVLNTYRWKWVMVGSGIFAFMLVNAGFTGFQAARQQKIIVYDVYKNSLIDLVNGRHCYTLQNEEMPEKSASFAAQNNRWKMGITKQETLNFSQDSLVILPHLKFQSGRFQFINQDFAILDRPLNEGYTGEKIFLNYILIRNNPDLEMAEISRIFDFQKIIFDSSNKNYQVEKWKAECDTLTFEYWDTAEKGAFVFNIE